MHFPRKTAAVLAVPVCALGIGLAGCSSDDDDSSTGTTAQEATTTASETTTEDAASGDSGSATAAAEETAASAESGDADSAGSAEDAGSADSSDTQVFEKSRLQDFLTDDVEKTAGVRPDQVACRDDLQVAENATQECAVHTDDGWQKLNVTLIDTATDDPKVSWQTEEDIIPEPDWVESAA